MTDEVSGDLRATNKRRSTRGTQRKAIEAFAKYRTHDEVDYCAFVGPLNGGHAYEIWYLEDDEWCISFIVLYSDGVDEFYESVQELVQEINLTRQLEKEALSLAVDRRIRLWVGAAAFLLALSVVLAMAALEEPKDNLTIIATIISVLASGCVAIFGVWIPKPWSSQSADHARADALQNDVTPVSHPAITRVRA